MMWLLAGIAAIVVPVVVAIIGSRLNMKRPGE